MRFSEEFRSMIGHNFWPSSDSFLDFTSANLISDGRARCISIAVCDAEGRPTVKFYQRQYAHFYFEFEVLENIEVPSGGLEFRDAAGHIVHGKNTLQYGSPVPTSVRSGSRLRFHQKIRLQISSGIYFFSVGLASISNSCYMAYSQGSLPHNQFDRLIREHCRLADVGSFQVEPATDGKLLHHGMADLPGICEVIVVEGEQIELPASRAVSHHNDSAPTVFHVTHWKAGSQWIHKILEQCVPDLIVVPQVEEQQFLGWPLLPGRVYPTVYVTRQQFDSVRLPPNSRRFVIIRDLRDTLMSAYFSYKVSHVLLTPQMAYFRKVLTECDFEEGLIYLMDEIMPSYALIQISWLEAGEKVIHYEDLLTHDLEILERVLLDYCQLPVSRGRLEEVVLSNRFDRVTGGRQPGQEDVTAHERKGISGDWRNYFSERIKKAFKARYGGLLVESGYEQDLNW